MNWDWVRFFFLCRPTHSFSGNRSAMQYGNITPTNKHLISRVLSYCLIAVRNNVFTFLKLILIMRSICSFCVELSNAIVWLRRKETIAYKFTTKPYLHICYYTWTWNFANMTIFKIVSWRDNVKRKCMMQLWDNLCRKYKRPNVPRVVERNIY